MTEGHVEPTWDQRRLQFQSRVVDELVKVITEFLDPETLGLAYGVTEKDVRYFAQAVLDDALGADIERFAATDPATRVAGESAGDYLLEAYKGVSAVLHYRVANALLYKSDTLIQGGSFRDVLDDPTTDRDTSPADTYLVSAARRISEQAAIQTTVEINPSARIGPGLVIDHGVNVRIGIGQDPGIVVGESCEIGENCTILNGVVLGAAEVNSGRAYTRRRHPKLGHNVTICAGAKVLGGISVGDGAWIGPDCIVTHDVPDGFRVQVVTQLQYERPSPGGEPGVRIYGLVPSGEVLLLYGTGLEGASIALADRLGAPILGAKVRTVGGGARGDEHIRLELELNEVPENASELTLEIIVGTRRLYLLEPPALKLIYARRASALKGAR